MVEKEDRQKRSTDFDEAYDSANNQHAVFRRSIEIVTATAKPTFVAKPEIPDFKPIGGNVWFFRGVILLGVSL